MDPRRSKALDLQQTRFVANNVANNATMPPALQRVGSQYIKMRRKDYPEEAEAKDRQREWCRETVNLLSFLDEQSAKRKHEDQAQAWAEQAKVMAAKSYRRCLEKQRNLEKVPWAYTDAPGYFQRPVIDPVPPDKYQKKLTRGNIPPSLKPFYLGIACLSELSPPLPKGLDESPEMRAERRKQEHDAKRTTDDTKEASDRSTSPKKSTFEQAAPWTYTDAPGYFQRPEYDPVPPAKYQKQARKTTPPKKSAKPFVIGAGTLSELSPPLGGLGD